MATFAVAAVAAAFAMLADVGAVHGQQDVLLPPGAAPSDFSSEVVDLPPGRGARVRYLLVRQNGLATDIGVVLFAGGNGLLNITADGQIGQSLAKNFLVRSRLLFAAQGLAVAVVDAPRGVALDGNVRLSAQYAQDMSGLIGDLRRRASLRTVWLVGTSSGTLSAAGVAARLPMLSGPAPPSLPPSTVRGNAFRPDGIVLTSTQSKTAPGLCGRTVFDAKLRAINVSAYLAAHRSDACACSPAKGMPAVLNALVRAPTKTGDLFSGGRPPISNDPCMAQTPHGFLGLEREVVGAIARWLKAH